MYNSLGEYNQSKELYEKALTIFKNIFGEDHAGVATSYSNLALVYNSLGEYNQARELFEKALMIYKKILGEDHESVGTVCSHLALLNEHLGSSQVKSGHAKASCLIL